MTIRRRGKSWQLDCGMIHGKRVQLSFSTKEAAVAEQMLRKAELLRAGHAAWSLSDEERIRFVAARERLSEVGATVEQAVDFFLRHSGPARKQVSWFILRSLFLEAKMEEGVSLRYQAQLKSVVKAFGLAGHDSKMVSEITARDIEGWLTVNGWAAKTWNNYRTDLRTAFSWGMENGYATINPAEAVPTKAADRTEDVKFLSTGECRALLQRAAEVHGDLGWDRRGLCDPLDEKTEDHRLLVPMLVIGLFAGLRPVRELGQMRWVDVLEEEGLLVVSAGRAKTRERRTVDLEPNAVAWLRWCRAQGMGQRPETTILPPGFDRRWKRLRKACGVLETWPHDAMRHSFATMHLAHFRNEARLQLYMGHNSAKLIYSNYRGLVTPAEAGKFWSLMPPA